MIRATQKWRLAVAMIAALGFAATPVRAALTQCNLATAVANSG